MAARRKHIVSLEEPFYLNLMKLTGPSDREVWVPVSNNYYAGSKQFREAVTLRKQYCQVLQFEYNRTWKQEDLKTVRILAGITC